MVRTVALIPARGGSVGVPRKNLALLAGRPLLVHTIDAAQQSGVVNVVYVSSDDSEILQTAEDARCRALRRPADLSSNSATAVDVVRHALDGVLRGEPDSCFLVYLQPTSPLRTAAHVREAHALMTASASQSVVSVVEMDKSPFKAFALNAAGELQSLFDEALSNANRQSLPKAFMPNGAIYGFTLGAFRRHAAFPTNGSIPYVMSRRESLDVDSQDDLNLVRALLEKQNA